MFCFFNKSWACGGGGGGSEVAIVSQQLGFRTSTRDPPFNLGQPAWPGNSL